MGIDHTMESGIGLLHGNATSQRVGGWDVVRCRLGWSIKFAAGRIGISPRHLDFVESGIRTPPATLIERMALAYGVEAGCVEVRRQAERILPRYDAESAAVWLGWLPVVVRGLGNEELLIAVGVTLRTMRDLPDDAPVYIRDADLPVLAPLFDLEDSRFGMLAASLLGLTAEEAGELLHRMLLAVCGAPDPWSRESASTATG